MYLNSYFEILGQAITQEQLQLESQIIQENIEDQEEELPSEGASALSRSSSGGGIPKKKLHTKKKSSRNPKKNKLKGGIIDNPKQEFITHVNFIEIYKQLQYLYQHFTLEEFTNFKAICEYYNLSIPFYIPFDIKEIIVFINRHFIDRYFIQRQNIVLQSILENLEFCKFDRFFEYLSLFLEIKKYADIVEKIENNIKHIEDTQDIDFQENVEQLLITSQSLDYYIERTIFSLYGDISLLKCIKTSTLDEIISKYDISQKKQNDEDLSYIIKNGIKVSDIKKIVNDTAPQQYSKHKLNYNIDLLEKIIQEYDDYQNGIYNT
jgi:hypothetical protein